MNLIEQLKRHEGFEANYYRDSVGKLTVGYGHNLDAPMPKELAEVILEWDASQAFKYARTLPYWELLNQARKDVITNMIFNLGATRFHSFKRMEAALALPDFSKASIEMLDSKWAIQVGDRARELASQMRNGEYALQLS